MIKTNLISTEKYGDIKFEILVTYQNGEDRWINVSKEGFRRAKAVMDLMSSHKMGINKVQTIKAIRSVAGWGLDTAKLFVETYVRDCENLTFSQ